MHLTVDCMAKVAENVYKLGDLINSYSCEWKSDVAEGTLRGRRKAWICTISKMYGTNLPSTVMS